jgi:uncharacterized RDD family membrane protein YckC
MHLVPRVLRSQGPRRVVSEPLNVAPALVGAVLASPTRRALAMAIDLALLALLAEFPAWGLVLALLVLAALVGRSLVEEGARRGLALAVAAVLVAAALAVAWAAGRPAAVDSAWSTETDAAIEQAERALAAAAAPASAPASTPDAAQLARSVAELQRLQAEHRPKSLADRVDEAVNDIGLGLGWGIVYFSLVPAFWPGRTLGKAWLKLRVVELTGRPLTPLRGLKRYGGYAAGVATAGLGFAQMLWDPNRQALHDKAAHTVVLDARVLPATPSA